METPLFGNRPYRSHKVPACDRCRQRKVRCNIDRPGQPCFFCREGRLTCQYTESRSKVIPRSEVTGYRPVKRLRPNVVEATMDNAGAAIKDSQHSSVGITSPGKSAIIIGPAVAEDIEILQRHIAAHKAGEAVSCDPYQTISHDSGNPIIYLTVPRCRKGLQLPIEAGKRQREIIEQIIGPFRDEVIRIYFDSVHPYFPVVDNYTASTLQQHKPFQTPSALLCTIYAIALPLWGRSDMLKLHPRPDSNFAWDQGVSALYEDFVTPSTSTILAAIIDLIGRPSVSMVGNIANSGRTVALAQSFGLHRDPSAWKITNDEKDARIRLWWGVLINDHWSSIAYGIPPSIAQGCYDVSLPVPQHLIPGAASQSRKRATMSFIQLCSLTQVLGDILPLVYRLEHDAEAIGKAIERLQSSLDDWEAQLPECVRPAVHERRTGTRGCSNLRFCFLSVKLLLSRLALRGVVQGTWSAGREQKHYRLAMLRGAASDLLDFISSLTESELQEFWLPYTAHLLVTATMILLRCTVEAPDADIKRSCVSKLLFLKERLKVARDTCDWELGDFCLERCSDPISRVAASVAQSAQAPADTTLSPADDSPGNPTRCEDGEPPSLMSDLLAPIDAFDYPWETLWDTFDGMSTFSF